MTAPPGLAPQHRAKNAAANGIPKGLRPFGAGQGARSPLRLLFCNSLEVYRVNAVEATARCWAEIDLDALCGNYLRAAELMEGTPIICVLKADAYGHGAATVGPALYATGARKFAVADGDEAEELLAACPDADVLTLGLTGEDQAVRLIRKNALFTLFSREQGAMLLRAAERAGQPVRVHVKLETGLYRLGFSGASAVEEIAALHASERMRMEGLFTHLALHDRDCDLAQFARFDAMRDALAAKGITFACCHALDSIGMVRYPERRMDAVRLGAWLYGNCPARYDHPEKCQPTMQFKARIAQLHTVAAGERIGYDDDHHLTRETRVATLTAGYSDGVPRLNHAGEVVIRGRRARVLGLVCMDQMMVDVTDIPDARPGDVVTFFGDGLPVSEYAAQARLNRNEALARLSRRVVRVYRRDGREFYSGMEA